MGMACINRFTKGYGAICKACSCHDFVLHNALTGGIPCREDAYAALQLYQLYVKDDPALMTYQELVEYELRKMKRTADSKPEAT